VAWDAADGEHDACGVGFVAHIKGAEVLTRIVEQGLKILREPRPPRRGGRRSS
jgi:glutamate synthase domain-containing protein 1